jgi:hypothetical protein
MSLRATLIRLPRYLWAAPCSAAGLVIAVLALLLGAKARVKNGTFQVVGGRLAAGIARLPTRLTILAFTNGHVIYAVNPAAMDSFRAHELVHVRQYERWGPLFPVLYLGSSLVQKLKGRDPYFANCFEREAHKADGDPTGSDG